MQAIEVVCWRFAFTPARPMQAETLAVYASQEVKVRPSLICLAEEALKQRQRKAKYHRHVFVRVSPRELERPGRIGDPGIWYVLRQRARGAVTCCGLL